MSLGIAELATSLSVVLMLTFSKRRKISCVQKHDDNNNTLCFGLPLFPVSALEHAFSHSKPSTLATRHILGSSTVTQPPCLCHKINYWYVTTVPSVLQELSSSCLSIVKGSNSLSNVGLISASDHK